MEDLKKTVRPPGDGEASDIEADAADPPATKLREISQKEKADFREQIRWLQNQDYERDNHAEAYATRNIRNPEVPHMVGMFPSAQLRHYQPTGIAPLVAFENLEVDESVLSDEVGTRKTYVVIGLMLHRDNQRKDCLSLSIEASQPKVTLLLVPKNLIHSWKRKILDFIDRLICLVRPGKREECLHYHNIDRSYIGGPT
jgi:SNF2 family DNA or RNA helicase